VRPYLYELNWLVETDVHSFLYREFKVFDGEEKVKKYGIKRKPNQMWRRSEGSHL